MKKYFFLLFVLVAVCTACSRDDRMPQEDRDRIEDNRDFGAPPPPPPQQQDNPFGKDSKIKFRGEIVDIFPSSTYGQPNSVLVIVRTEEGDIPVELGPESYLGDESLVQVHTPIKVKGFKVMTPNGPMVVAKQIKVNGERLKLRDGNGRPRWPERD